MVSLTESLLHGIDALVSKNIYRATFQELSWWTSHCHPRIPYSRKVCIMQRVLREHDLHETKGYDVCFPLRRCQKLFWNGTAFCAPAFSNRGCWGLFALKNVRSTENVAKVIMPLRSHLQYVILSGGSLRSCQGSPVKRSDRNLKCRKLATGPSCHRNTKMKEICAEKRQRLNTDNMKIICWFCGRILSLVQQGA